MNIRNENGTEREFTMDLNLKEIQANVVSLITNLKRVEFHYGQEATEKLVKMICDGNMAETPDLDTTIQATLFAGANIAKVTKDRVQLVDGRVFACCLDTKGLCWTQSYEAPKVIKVKKSVTVEPVPEPSTPWSEVDGEGREVTLHSL